jgi:HlyD family secretion protein
VQIPGSRSFTHAFKQASPSPRLARRRVARRPPARLALAWPRLVGPEVEVVVAERGRFVQSIVTSGRVRPPARATLATLVAGRVAAIDADEGQKIRAGQALMRLDDGEAQATLDQAKAAVDAASAQNRQVRTVNVKDAREAVTRAQTRLDEAQRTHARIQQLFTAGAVPRETLEDAGTSLSLAESELRAAQSQQADVAGPRRAGSNAAKHQAEAALAAAEVRFSYQRLTSPFEGVVIERLVEQGDVVQAGMPAFVVVRQGATELIVEPDERNLALLAVGQLAIAVLGGLPRRPLRREGHLYRACRRPAPRDHRGATLGA